MQKLFHVNCTVIALREIYYPDHKLKVPMDSRGVVRNIRAGNYVDVDWYSLYEQSVPTFEDCIEKDNRH